MHKILHILISSYSNEAVIKGLMLTERGDDSE